MPASDRASNRRVEQGEATRAVLIGVARRLFAEKGFAATSTEEVVQAAQVTRGALYHHFRGKDDLFRAVFESIETELAARVVEAAARAADPLDALRRGFGAFLDACLEPDVRRIVLQEAPSVLGWETWHEIDVEHAFGLVLATLQTAVDAGLIPRQPVEPLAHLIVGAVTQAGLAVGASAEPRTLRTALLGAFGRLVDGLRA